ncbi:unnamed protein product [Rotaria sp. Silwood1]|nr:unnamed protein product [Rotaria sp. Silwood1]
MTKRIQKPTITVSTDINGNQDINITNDENNMTIEETYHDKDVKAGETGLGKAATAGIACGIIFSALIFTVEIIYFKFIYSGGANSGPSRSAAYRT